MPIAGAVFFGQKIRQFDGGLILGLLGGIAHERQQHVALIVSIHCRAGHDWLLRRAERKRFFVGLVMLGQIGQQRTLCGRILSEQVGQLAWPLLCLGGRVHT